MKKYASGNTEDIPKIILFVCPFLDVLIHWDCPVAAWFSGKLIRNVGYYWRLSEGSFS